MTVGEREAADFVRRNLPAIALLLERKHEHTWDRKYPIDFVDEFDLKPGRDDIRAAMSGPEMVLYMHVPFCTQKCDFCTFYRFGSPASFGTARYVDCLKAELEHYLRLRRDRTLLSVYMGGGTPTMLAPEDLVDLLGFVRKEFRLAPDAWVSVESEPHLVSDEMADALARAGVTDVTLGIQTFNETTLKSVNRRAQSNAAVHEAVRRLRRAGPIEVSLDLIFGLTAGETAGEFLRDNLPHLAELQPETVVVYPLAHYRKHPGLLSVFPADALDRIYRGVEEASPSVKKRPYHCQYAYYRFQELADVAGVGMGAHGFFWPGGRRMWVKTPHTQANDLEAYERDAKAGTLTWAAKSAPADETLRWYVIWNLYRAFGVSLTTIARRFPGREKEARRLLASIEPWTRREGDLVTLGPGYERALDAPTGNGQTNYFLFCFERLYSPAMKDGFVRYIRAHEPLPVPRA